MTRSQAASRQGASRLTAALAVALALALVTPGAILGTQVPGPRTAVPDLSMQRAEDYGLGVSIEPAGWTNSPQVTLHVLPPPDNESVLRISNDGASWIEVPYAERVSWSLIDPAAGGVDVDGPKQLTVWYGNGGEDWRYYSNPTVNLDRSAPSSDGVSGVRIDGRLWRGVVLSDGNPLDAEIAATRYSLDGGGAWQPWATGVTVDVWNAPGAAAWAAGDRAITLQLRDVAGNVSDPITTTAEIVAPHFHYPTYEWNLPGAAFETPYPAITGQPFTIRVVYPAGYTLPSNAWCQWILYWGNDEEVFGPGGPTWGELFIERSKADGACAEWTFTVPYRGARQFAWKLFVGTKNANTEPMELVGSIIERGDGEGQIFRALDGPHDERFGSSSIPFAYVLPETTISKLGDPVTYRLHTVGTSTVPQSGMWWATPLGCDPNPAPDQVGGNTFTYRPRCGGPWITGWTGVMAKGYMRSQYDPLVDGRAPTVQRPLVKLRPGATGASVPGVVLWSGQDRGSGVQRFVLEASRNGGAWRAVTLPSRLTTSIQRSFSTSGSYRFRVKARDRVGNWSSWTYGPTIRAGVLEQGNSAVTWYGAWTTVREGGLSGGTARATDASGSSVRLITTARSVAVLTRKGPGRGLAQVWVDGALAATVDLGAPALGGKTIVYARTWSGIDRHVIRVVALGTQGRPVVEVDAFIVLR